MINNETMTKNDGMEMEILKTINDLSPDELKEIEDELEETEKEELKDPDAYISSFEGYADDNMKIYMRDVLRYPLLTHEKELELAKQAKMGDRAARDLLINSNLRLVISMAKRYLGRGLELEDLIQEGNLGLMRAVNYFDYELGYHFSTYATWWIRQAIVRGVENTGRAIRVPVHFGLKISKMKSVIKRYSIEHGCEPDVQTLSRLMNTSEEQIMEYMRWIGSLQSLDMPVGDDMENTMGDFVANTDKTLSPEDSFMQKDLIAAIERAMEDLQPREKEILTLRFGLNGERRHTLDEIGTMMGLTRERIRQIEGRAIKKLQYPRRKRILTDYYAS